MVLLGGLILQQGGSDAAGVAPAVDLFRRAAGRGNVDAQYNLGVCLRRGLGIEQNTAEAERAYRAAAEKGHRSAQLALGSLVAQTATREEQWREAAHWYRLAADGGHPAAMLSLGQLHESGRGVAADREAALALYRQALSAGLDEAAGEIQRMQPG
jgi:hypothetical protein